MGDEDVSGLGLVLDRLEQVQDFGPRRGVEHRGRLVEHHELGLGDQRARNPHPLLLARGQVGRIVVEDVAAEPHALQHRADTGPALGAPHIVQRERLVHRLIDRESGIERAEGVLEDELHPRPERPEPGRVELADLLVAERDPPLGGLDQAQHAAADRGLARAALADQAQRLAALERERDVVDRDQVLVFADREDLGQILDREQRHRPSSRRARRAASAARSSPYRNGRARARAAPGAAEFDPSKSGSARL